MGFFEKRPMAMIALGVAGISLSSIFVKFSTAPAAVTAAWRLLWTVILMSPVVIGKKELRQELSSTTPRNILLSCLSGFFLAVHFALWFESLHHTSVASSTTIVCTEVIWVSLGYWLFRALTKSISLSSLYIRRSCARFSPQRTHLVSRPIKYSMRIYKNQALFTKIFALFQHFFNVIASVFKL